MSKELTGKIKTALGLRLQNCELSNEEMVELIDLIGRYMNLKTISDYAKFEKITYNGTIQRIGTGKIKTIDLFNVKFVIDNE